MYDKGTQQRQEGLVSGSQSAATPASSSPADLARLILRADPTGLDEAGMAAN